MQILSHSFSFIVLTLIASLTASCGQLIGAEPASFHITRTPTGVTIHDGARALLDYRSAASPAKPYVRELFTPNGMQILRDQVSDHKHHHGLMFAVGANGVNFWEETAGAGTQKPRGEVETVSDPFLGSPCTRIIQTLDWADVQGKQLLVERREVGVAAITLSGTVGRPLARPDVTLALWTSELSPAAGVEAVKLDGHHYYGLGMRFVQSMDTGGRFFNSSQLPGDVVRGSERLVAAKWCAYTAKADGKPVTVAIFDHPSNPRHPNKIFTMSSPFAYLSATLNLWKEPLLVKAGAKLKLSYAAALWDDETPAAQIEALYEKWSSVP